MVKKLVFKKKHKDEIMIQGFNHNIQYQGIVFHVQTEQLAESNYITHVFSEGYIIFTLKSSCGVPENSQVFSRDWTHQQMASQHKKVLKNLISGQYHNEVSELIEHRRHKTGSDDPDNKFSFYLLKGSERTIISEEEVSEIMRLSDIMTPQKEPESQKKKEKKFSFYISTSRQKTRID